MSREITFIVGSERVKINLNGKQASQFNDEYQDILFAKNEIYIKSNVQTFVLQNFLDYFIKSKPIPDDSLYSIDYMNQYYFLSEEFGINGDLISNDKYKELLPFSIIKNFPLNDNVNKSDYEKFISCKIDYYIDKYPQYMSKIPIPSLFNILNQSTQFNHIEVYHFIKSQNDNTYFALLSILDSSKLSKDIVRECISNKSEHFGFVPYNCDFIENLIDENSRLENSNKELKDELNSEKYTKRKNYYFLDYKDEKDEGIIPFLVRNQNNKYDPDYVASMSSGDIYSSICPGKDGKYGGFFTHTNHSLEYAPVENTELTIELQNKTKVSSIKFFGPRKDCYKGHQIKKFSYIIYDDDKPLETKEINETLSEGKIITVDLKQPVDLSKITIKTIGIEEEGTKWPLFGGVELFSEDHKEGLFKDLIKNSNFHDPHRCGVFISATQYDTNKFYHFQSPMPNKYVIATLNYENDSWFKIELTKGKAIITGFIFQKAESHFPIDYKIIASDDDKKDEKDWLLLHEGKGESIKELVIKKHFNEYKPARFIKIILTGINSSSDYQLSFCHFDIFGFYLPN